MTPASGFQPQAAAHPLLQASPVAGECRVMCFSPDHGKTLPELAPAALRGVVQAWMEQSADMGRRHRWVQVFENKGAMMGCSNPHPHGQVWATSYVPQELATDMFEPVMRSVTHSRGLFGLIVVDESEPVPVDRDLALMFGGVLAAVMLLVVPLTLLNSMSITRPIG